MAFRVKDLMIQVLPSAAPGAEFSTSPTPCGRCTNCTGCTKCTINTCGFSPCRPPWASGTLIDPAGVDPRQLALLKQQLKQALDDVERQERALAEAMQPQTVEEVEQLEQKIKEALDHLRGQKQKMRRRGAKKKK